MTPEARFVVNTLIFVGGNGLLVASCLLAWIRGGLAERLGAGLYFASASFDVAIRLATGQALAIVPELMFDGLVAVGFLVLAIRYNSLWLGAAMMLKGVQLALHAAHLTDGADLHIGPFNVYTLSLGVVSMLISSTIIAGTIAGMRSRRRTRPEPSLVGAEVRGALAQ